MIKAFDWLVGAAQPFLIMKSWRNCTETQQMRIKGQGQDKSWR